MHFFDFFLFVCFFCLRFFHSFFGDGGERAGRVTRVTVGRDTKVFEFVKLILRPSRSKQIIHIVVVSTIFTTRITTQNGLTNAASGKLCTGPFLHIEGKIQSFPKHEKTHKRSMSGPQRLRRQRSCCFSNTFSRLALGLLPTSREAVLVLRFTFGSLVQLPLCQESNPVLCFAIRLCLRASHAVPPSMFQCVWTLGAGSRACYALHRRGYTDTEPGKLPHNRAVRKADSIFKRDICCVYSKIGYRQCERVRPILEGQ